MISEMGAEDEVYDDSGLEPWWCEECEENHQGECPYRVHDLEWPVGVF